MSTEELPQSIDATVTAPMVDPEQLTQVTAAELGRLHGVGPRAVRLLAEVVAERGLSFANEEPQPS
jgi:hypothetical protein